MTSNQYFINTMTRELQTIRCSDLDLNDIYSPITRRWLG